MKRIISILCALALMCAFFTCNAAAEGSNAPYIVDAAELLDDSEESALLTKIESLKQKYSIDAVIHTTNSIDGISIRNYADNFYDYNGYGVGEDRSGLLFMLNMNNGEEDNRDYYTSTTGSAINALTDYAIRDSDSCINSKILPLLKDNEYYKAFDEYLTLVDIFFNQAAVGEPYSSSNPYQTKDEIITNKLITEAGVIIFALLAALIVILILRSKMNTARIKTQACDYIVPGSTVITGKSEMFSHNTVSRIAKPTESSSGSSTHTGSSGTTHGGGGGKF